MGRYIKKIIIVLILVGIVFVILNADFFAKNIRFGLFRRYAVDPATQIVEGPEARAEPNLLWITALDIKAPVQYVDQADENVYQQALQKGVVHFPGTAMPGDFGNAYFFGHSSDYLWSPGDYKTVFAVLPRIQIGTEIKISGPDGAVYTYVAKQTFVVAPNDTSVLDQRNYQQKILTLQTSYPVGTALKRYIVVAELK